jgi:NAD(P)-dependent dehydrogenase (short-subunit alcohol dehydrogenase family)
VSSRVALVTGAGSGIGRASALALAADGFHLVLAGRRRDALEGVAQEIQAAGGAALAVPGDVRDEASVIELFQAVRDWRGRLDLLFNNAGIWTPSTAIEDVDHARFLDAVATNLTGAVLCTREAFRIMKDQDPRGGRIINNGSISAHVPRPHALAYTVTKHAITGLTRSSSLDGREHGIACGQIDIGNAATDLFAGGAMASAQPDGSMRQEPTMDVADAARTVAFMASLPLEANIQFVTVMATTMPYIGRG